MWAMLSVEYELYLYRQPQGEAVWSQRRKEVPNRMWSDVPNSTRKEKYSYEFLKPIQLSYRVMIRALRFAAHNVAHFKWNKGTTQAYLRSCAIPDRVTDKMYNQ